MDSPMQQQQQHAQAQYTTVGSIYNPQATPLQPPTRNRRTVKWPPSDYPKPTLPGYPYRNSSSPPTTANSLLQYSPLQQNNIRAVSPQAVSPDSMAGMIAGNPLSVGTNAAASSQAKHESANIEDNDGDEIYLETELEKLKQMPVRSLNSLAAYPNRMQKAAQNLLSRARPQVTLGSTQSDPGFMRNLLQSDGASDYGTTYSRESTFQGSTFNSVLSKGPGAPQPLTAGPPGLRQHTKSVMAETMNPAAPRYPPGLQQSILSKRRSTPNPVRSALSNDASKITDTLTADDARIYYPSDELPHNFNFKTEPIDEDWVKNYPLDRYGLSKLRPQDDMETHQTKINSQWYSDNDRLDKKFEQATVEKNQRALEHTLGLPRRETTTPVSRELVCEGITIEEANTMPVREHAAPLLSMAFQTLLNPPTLGHYDEMGNWEWGV